MVLSPPCLPVEIIFFLLLVFHQLSWIFEHCSTVYLCRSSSNKDMAFVWSTVVFLLFFLSRNSPMDAIFAQFLSFVEWWTLTLTEVRPGVVNVLFWVVLWPFRWAVKLLWPVSPGKVHYCSMFSPFMGNDCGSLEYQSLRDGFVSLSRMISAN